MTLIPSRWCWPPASPTSTRCSWGSRSGTARGCRGWFLKALHILVDYVYTSEVDVTEDNLQTLLPAANLLQLTDVRDACCEFLQSQLHPTNCLGIRAFADLHGCMDLLTTTEGYIERHFTEVDQWTD